MEHDAKAQIRYENPRSVEREPERRWSLPRFLVAHRFANLLAILVIVGGVIPVIEEIRGGARPIVAEAILMFALIGGCYAAVARKRTFAALLLVGTAGVVVELVTGGTDPAHLTVVSSLLMIVFFATVALVILRFVLHAERVTGEIIAAALCVYFLLGTTLAFAYSLMDLLQPSAFRTDQTSLWDFVYYSFATLTTLGYADVVAGSRLTKSLSSLEAIMGQLYVAVLISRLVGMHIAHASAPGDRQ